MIELGQLEAAHGKFGKTRLVAVSIEDQAAAQQTQKDFPHLIVIADKERKLAEALDLIHPASAPDGGDTAAPTTVLIDGAGQVRWTFRSDSVFRRLSPDEVLAAVDEHLKKKMP
jgi:peroxiredoxin